MTHSELSVLRQQRWTGWIAAEASVEALLQFTEVVGFLPARSADPDWPSLTMWTAASVSSVAAAWSGPEPSRPRPAAVAAETEPRTMGAESEAGAAAPLSEAVAHAWIAQLQQSKHVAEVGAWPSGPVYVSSTILSDLYIWRGSRDPRREVERQAARGSLSPLAAEIFALLQAGPPLNATELRSRLGGQRTSLLAVLRALGQLAVAMAVVPIPAVPSGFGQGTPSQSSAQPAVGEPAWQPITVAFPSLLLAPHARSRAAAAVALVGKYLEVAIVGDESRIADFFSPFLSRGSVRTALQALTAARQIEATALEGHPAFGFPGDPAH